MRTAEVRLVAMREIRQRVRTRAFQISTGLLVVGAIVAVVLSRTLGNDAPARPVEVGVVGAAPAAITARLPVHLERLPGEDEARTALRSGTIDLALIDSTRLLVREHPETGSRLAAVAASIAASVATRSALSRAGVPAATVRRALADARPIPIRATEPTSANEDDEEAGVGFLAALILYLALIFAGYSVATGVVEEKTSRVVEVRAPSAGRPS
jgi:ABC-2 type transport system permease protein